MTRLDLPSHPHPNSIPGPARGRKAAYRGTRSGGTCLLLLSLTACGSGSAAADPDLAPRGAVADSGWVALFNGRDLTGWTPRIRYSPAGVDSLGTFRVEDGLLTVSYEGYDTFGDRFGHLFFDRRLSSYDLRVEYRFVGEQVEGGEGWARANSGIMIHAQSPVSMPPEQDFPISVEAQLLAGLGEGDRPTANVCTPGTEIDLGGEQAVPHCIESSSRTFGLGEWVTVELVVRGDSLIAHLVEGDTVLAYAHPRVGGGVVNGYDPEAKIDGTPLTGGYIALQSESHPIQFRRVWLREVPPSR